MAGNEQWDMLGLSQRSAIGIVLMIAGTAAFFPPSFVSASGSMSYLAVVATALLTIGTYLIGTDVEGYPA